MGWTPQVCFRVWSHYNLHSCSGVPLLFRVCASTGTVMQALPSVAAYVQSHGGSHVIEKVLIANNGLSAVKGCDLCEFMLILCRNQLNSYLGI